MSRKIVPQDELNELLRAGKLSRETICAAAKISEPELTKFLAGEFHELQRNDMQFLGSLAMYLGVGLYCAEDDLRVRAIVEALVVVYKLDTEKLSLLLGVEKPLIEKLLAGEDIDLTQKYHLAVRSSYVLHALNRPQC